MATTTTNFGWDIPQSTDLVKDGATAIAALGQDIDTAFIDLKGGTTGQVLAKASGTDLDFTWATDASGIPATIFDAKGDLIAASAADTAARLAVGTNGHVLTADSTAATGLKWAAAAGGGKVLQVVQDIHYQLSETTSTSYADTGLSVSITPSSATSKVLVIATIQGVYRNAGNLQTRCQLKLLRASTDLVITEGNGATGTSQYNDIGTVAMTYLDEPATTSATTYKIQFASSVSGQGAGINDYYATNNTTSSIVVMEIGA